MTGILLLVVFMALAATCCLALGACAGFAFGYVHGSRSSRSKKPGPEAAARIAGDIYVVKVDSNHKYHLGLDCGKRGSGPTIKMSLCTPCSNLHLGTGK